MQTSATTTTVQTMSGWFWSRSQQGVNPRTAHRATAPPSCWRRTQPRIISLMVQPHECEQTCKFLMDLEALASISLLSVCAADETIWTAALNISVFFYLTMNNWMLPHKICAPLSLLCFDASKCVWNACVIHFLHNRGPNYPIFGWAQTLELRSSSSIHACSVLTVCVRPCWTDGQTQKLYIFYTAKRIKKALRAANDSLVPATCGPELLLLWPHAIPEELDLLCNRIGLQASHSRSHTQRKNLSGAWGQSSSEVFSICAKAEK